MSPKQIKNRGSFYIETVIALAMLGIISTSLLPLIPRLLKATNIIKKRSELILITEYAGEYLNRWANFSPLIKHKSINFFSDGQELELTNELRVNQLPWAEPLTTEPTAISDHYKASITFWDTVTRNNSAIIKVLVWYDQNNDDTCSPTENSYGFTTIITEKRDL